MDGESLLAWLEALPQETEPERDEARRWAVAIAHRAAMRVLPVYWSWSVSISSIKRGNTALPVLRCALVTDIARKKLNPQIEMAARSARWMTGAGAWTDDLPSERSSRLEKAAFVAVAADTAGVAVIATEVIYRRNYEVFRELGEIKHPRMLKSGGAIWENIRRDCTLLMEGEALDRRPLWDGDNRLASLWAETRPQILAQGDGWRFWVDWYDNALHGRPQDYESLTKIALIEPEDWNKGADHVNALISGIIRAHKPARQPDPPKLTDVERSHIALVLAASDPARQSAEFLREQFERMEMAYRQAVGCPNETPPEIEPIVTLSHTFGQIAVLLRVCDDKDRQIIELAEKIKSLEATNANLVVALRGERGAFMRGIVIGALGDAFGAAIIQGFGYLTGPFGAEAIGPLWDLLKPEAPAPQAPVYDSPPIFET